MSSLQRTTSRSAYLARVDASRAQRVRHGVRDQILVMAFSAVVSLILGLVLVALVTHALGGTRP